MDLIAAIRDLHAPVRETFRPLLTPDVEAFWLRCDGCDLGPHPEDRPDWPCRTAELVYTAEEIKKARDPGGR